MKLILAIVQADAVDPVSRALVDQKYSVTQISSVGGFLRRGSTTLVVGVDDSQIESVISIIRAACDHLNKTEGHPATIFVLNASEYIQM